MAKHDLIEIHRSYVMPGVDMVTRWCRACGAVVVDGDSDGRVSPGHYREMESPAMTRVIRCTHAATNDASGG